jgi:predicted AAA+ superfamily ATPase
VALSFEFFNLACQKNSIMRYIHRELEAQLAAAVLGFPVVVVTGPRRAGKTYLLRHPFPKASYHLFEDPDVVARFRHDPQGFLDDVRLPAILDEMQNVPKTVRTGCR